MIRLPPILRPRLTWRYVLRASVVLYVSYCFLFSSPLFASNLPKYTGNYAVGTIDVEVPCKQRVISGLMRKDNGEPALKLDTVLFSLYSPVDKAWKVKPFHDWVSKPISVTAEGYASFGHINNFFTNSFLTASLWGLVGGIKIPAFVDVELHKVTIKPKLPDEVLWDAIEGESNSAPLPVMIFSHGFASSRTDYTH
jgi:platelet-activating factor acetylhydrolase